MTVNLSIMTVLTAKGKFPVSIISHGSGGTNLGHRSIAFELVRHGFIVGMPLHPNNNFRNNRAEGTVNNLKNRPGHIRAAIDALISNPQFAPSLDAEKIAVIGHSVGGYTALAVSSGLQLAIQFLGMIIGLVT